MQIEIQFRNKDNQLIRTQTATLTGYKKGDIHNVSSWEELEQKINDIAKMSIDTDNFEVLENTTWDYL